MKKMTMLFNHRKDRTGQANTSRKGMRYYPYIWARWAYIENVQKLTYQGSARATVLLQREWLGCRILICPCLRLWYLNWEPGGIIHSPSLKIIETGYLMVYLEGSQFGECKHSLRNLHLQIIVRVLIDSSCLHIILHQSFCATRTNYTRGE